MRSLRLLFAAVVLGTAAASGVGASVQAAPQPACGGHVSDAGNGWRGIRPPFPSGPSKVTHVVATPYVPDRMFATNGSEVMLTNDGGCHWIGVVIPKAGSLLGVLPAPLSSVLTIPTTTSVTALAAPSSATISNRAYVGLEDSSLVRNALRIGYYDGNFWRYDASGLPSSGRVVEIAGSPTAPTIAYAMVDSTSSIDQNPGLYVTRDGGKTWSLRNPSAQSSNLHGLKVDPNVPTLIYALGGNGLQTSNDGGLTFTPGTRSGRDIASYDVANGGGSARIVQGHTTGSYYDRSNDAGSNWAAVRAPVIAKEVAIQPTIDQVGVSDGKQLWLEPSSDVHKACNVTPGVGAPTQLQFTAPLASGYAAVGVRGDAIVRAVFKLDKCGTIVIKGSDLTPIILLPQVLPHQFPSTLLPGRTAVSLPPGGHQDVNYRLLLPRTPSPIDVMFLVDTTDSMTHTIDGLRQDLKQIVNDLATVGLDVQFGVGDFHDYPPTDFAPGDGEIGDYPYRLDAKIGRVTAVLQAALSKLHASGGGDPPEADLTALYQSTTGAGQRIGRHVLVRPGLQAGYRPDALKLAVLATDAPFHQESDYLTPSWSRTMSTLRSYGVHPIGIAVERVDGQGATAGFPSLSDENRLTTQTGSVAPRGGVDCNGDLKVDIGAGAPFVCKLPIVRTSTANVGGITIGSKTQPVKLAPAITTAAESLADFRTVGLQFKGHPGIARVVGPSPLPRVNLKSDNTIDFTVRFTCPKLRHPQTFNLGVDAGAVGRVFASSAAKVQCGAVPPPHHAAVISPLAAAAAVAPIAAPPAAPPAPANPVPNANPNPNPALNANVGFASQEEQQRQLAFANADAGIEEDTSTEMAMSRLGGGAAILLAAAAGYAARRRFAAAWHRR